MHFGALSKAIQHAASNAWKDNKERGNYFLFVVLPNGEWADPGGTAIPGQPVATAEQAPNTSPSAKNQFNIVDPRWGSYQILS